eukprot:CAMPEP_0119131572 /NCGR_PEP_ID=MMETSP1310-20130426/10456_1 /TAXON_ID=464262 /ORGANISM="Genus nov. species nov., Strain RCC2339" /LENGTH=570 /DNA_ID=CAMNT_0007122155 /DNA_START=74 /DNA_END=1786 /DNA_ORIENTATION=+
MKLRDQVLCLWVVGMTLLLEVNGVVVETPLGSVEGLDEGTHFAFFGIPYALPPVGQNRWKSPLPVKPFSKTPYDATIIRPICVQDDIPPLNATYRPSDSSEDCLYLNVFTPKGVAPSSGFPVMFFIHGGGYIGGAGSDNIYWGDVFANHTDTILVTINYRLGATGFLFSREAGFGGNYGIRDQQMALMWVRDNIAAFGGNPANVLLFGQSAGGISVGLHLTIASSYGLFQTAILHSNAPAVGMQIPEQGEYFFEQFVNATGCDPSDTGCLYSLSTNEILNAQLQVLPDLSPPLEPQTFLPWMPVIDGTFIEGAPYDRILEGQVAPDVYTIWGSTKNETSGVINTFRPLVPILPSMYKVALKAIFGADADAVFAEYPANRPGQVRGALTEVVDDWIFTCAAWAQCRIIEGLRRTSRYVFLHDPSADPVYPDSVVMCAGDKLDDSCHGEELQSVFGTAALAGSSFTPDEVTLSQKMNSMWAAAAYNRSSLEQAWPEYDAEVDNAVAFEVDREEDTIHGFRAEKCLFWASLGYYEASTTSTPGAPEVVWTAEEEALLADVVRPLLTDLFRHVL